MNISGGTHQQDNCSTDDFARFPPLVNMCSMKNDKSARKNCHKQKHNTFQSMQNIVPWKHHKVSKVKHFPLSTDTGRGSRSSGVVSVGRFFFSCLHFWESLSSNYFFSSYYQHKFHQCHHQYINDFCIRYLWKVWRHHKKTKWGRTRFSLGSFDQWPCSVTKMIRPWIDDQ